MMENFEYQEYSLKNISTWVQDAISAEVEPEKIFNTIKKAVEEEYYIFKNCTNRCYELLALLNGNGKGHIKEYDEYVKSSTEPLVCDKNDPSEECKSSWTSFWEENYYPKEHEGSDISNIMPPWGHSDMEALNYTEDELNAMCDKAASDDEKDQCHEYNLREAEYYSKSSELDLNSGPYQKYVGWTEVKDSDFNQMFPDKEKYKSDIKEQISRNDLNRIDYKNGLIYESPDGGKTVYSRKPGETEKTLIKEEKTNKWILPIECDSANDELFLTLPKDLLKRLDWKEDDEIEWVENKNNTYIIRKVNK